MYSYSGITALVTGASKGLGKAYAHELARRGAHLVLVARSGDALREVAAGIRAEHGTDVTPLVADLTDAGQVTALIAELDRREHTIDLLVNNAGAGTVGPFLTSSLARNVSSVELNVIALLRLTHLLGGRMADRGHGGIINVASIAAFQTMPYQASYAASKAFVLSFTEALAEELRGTSVRVMAAHPGATDTGFFDTSSATMNPAFTDAPEHVAAKTLDAFAKGALNSYPGRALFRPVTWITRLLPRATATRLIGRLNRSLGLHRAHDLDGTAPQDPAAG
ncbi:SDR family NAD(P)-dependent oxidoreductase [Streptantibioticus cattleyicolor]|uniref:Dehydrogenase n=1 Tax=Streptantibioticus cattleyicolor (strain ATCC 35852 / DSM 46488 / JCM 4925 / NBRC 14057 / NRRL 8057) TaxID=1003195 RepID=F8JKM6_STREN|nr:SDR family oxidoreductase [Streptantibioticus cattleyicolor]AEW98483.1 dehydrogenase [Streptantibioticus cattleyicolor NRRL 8057 = DSM 46488]CCB72460.1 putative dehydrogenase [Streptantibioticus cattleyicolor NRRL 8057 = DSM 46488]